MALPLLLLDMLLLTMMIRCRHKEKKKWRSEIRVCGKRRTLGLFEEEAEAARAYDAEARKHLTEETLPKQVQYGTSNFPAGERGAIKAAAAPTSSRFRGVYWHKQIGGTSKWTAQIRLSGKSKNLGSFDDEEEAAHAYDAEARKHFMEETLPRQSQSGGFNFPASERGPIKDAAKPISSAYRGVNWDKRKGKWKTQLALGGKKKHLGHFEDEEDAARAYDAEARKQFTEETLPQQSQYGGFNFPAEEIEDDAPPLPPPEAPPVLLDGAATKEEPEVRVKNKKAVAAAAERQRQLVEAQKRTIAAQAKDIESLKRQLQQSTAAAAANADAPAARKTKTQPIKAAAPPSSAFRGVTWRKRTNKWQAAITLKDHAQGSRSRSKILGSFEDAEEAARAYDTEARKHYDEETLPQQEHYGGYNFPAGERDAIKDAAASTSSAYRGVSWSQKAGNWEARLRLNGKQKYLGKFVDEEGAALAYDAEARKHFTEETLPTQSQYGGFNFDDDDADDEDADDGDAPPLSPPERAAPAAAIAAADEDPARPLAVGNELVYKFVIEGSACWFLGIVDSVVGSWATALFSNGEQAQVLCTRKNHGSTWHRPGAASTPAVSTSAASAPAPSGPGDQLTKKRKAAPKPDAARTTSVYRGVSRATQRGKWVATLRFDGKRQYLGLFDDEEEAARAYDAEARKHYTEETLPQQEQHGGFSFPPGERAAIKSVVAPPSSAFRGVNWDAKSSKWKAQLKVGGKTKSLGHFEDESKAARAFDEEARKHFTEETLPLQGQRGGFNFPKGERGPIKQAVAPASSSFRGVMFHKRDGKWQAKIRIDGKTKHLGYFDDEEEAAHAYDEEARRHWDEETLPQQGSGQSFNFPASKGKRDAERVGESKM